MTFGEYYSDRSRSSLSIEQRFMQVRQDALNRVGSKVTETECQKLQNFLNQAFYPNKYINGDGTKSANKIISLINQAYMQEYNAKLNDFTMGASQVSYGVQASDIPTLVREKYEQFKHNERIYKTTIQSRLDNVRNVLNQLNDISQTDTAMAQTKADLMALEKNLAFLADLKGVKGKTGIEYLDLKNDSKLLEAVNNMDMQYQALSQIGGLFSPQDYGQILEWVLQALSNGTDSLINKMGDHLTDEMVKEIKNTAGASRVIGNNNLMKVTVQDIKTDGQFVQKGKDSQGATAFQISDGVNSFSFKAEQGFNPDSNRQGKMDVDFTFNDNGTLIPFRISAKNWQTLQDRDFGETSVIFALLRSAGNDGAIDYIYAMQDENNSNVVKNAHTLAKLSIIVDTLMGYSQKDNYADTLVINVRSEERVIVTSISSILNQINNDLDKIMNLSGYDGDTFHSNLITLRKAVEAQKINRSSQYQNLSFKYLQATKVRVQYAAISNFIGTSLTPLST